MFKNLKYRFMHWLFQWKTDKDGDIAFVLFNLVVFIKYKEHTIIQLNGYKLKPAGKYQGYQETFDTQFDTQTFSPQPALEDFEF